jgi:hypothetical protein
MVLPVLFVFQLLLTCECLLWMWELIPRKSSRVGGDWRGNKLRAQSRVRFLTLDEGIQVAAVEKQTCSAYGHGR